jgi:signal peptidase I
MPKSTRGHWYAVTDEYHIESEEPVAEVETPSAGDRLAKLLLLPLILAFVVAFAVFNIMYTPSLVDGSSMVPTLADGDRALVTKSYNYPIRGDVVIADIGVNGAKDTIIKRIVGVAGDTVTVKNDVATVNGVTESPSTIVVHPDGGEDRGPTVVPDGHVYLMGDNRVISLDSRFIGPVAIDRLYGKVVFVFWPTGSVGKVD